MNEILEYYNSVGFLFFWSQVGLTLISVVAHYMMQSLDYEIRKYGTLVGMSGQPFWFAFAYSAEAWFLFFVSFLYLHSWSKGFYNYWLKHKVDKWNQQQ